MLRSTLHVLMVSTDFSDELDVHGVLRVPAALDCDKLAWLWSEVDAAKTPGAVGNRSGVYGARALLAARPELRDVLGELGVDEVAARALRQRGFPIDALFFDKNSDANWAVPAHQDIIMPVPSNAIAPPVRNVRTRHGTTFAEPPVHVLQELVAVRVHWDDSSATTGGLSLVPGSHARGRLSDAELRRIPSEAFQHCDCYAGDLLLMKPLIVHRSPRAARGMHRRVLHALYAPVDGWHARLSRSSA